MTNKEYYKDEIFNIACKGDSIAFDNRTNEIVGCSSIDCLDCKFSRQGGCKTAMSKWLEEEYTEPPIDWTKVEVDAKILVRDSQNEEWYKRHFAKYEYCRVYTFMDSNSSWTSEDINDVVSWKYAKLYDDSQEIKNIKVASCDYDKVVEILSENGVEIK